MRKSVWLTETLAGITTFLTIAYIVVVNPSVLASEGTGMPFSGVLTATVLLCFSMTLLMGLYAKLPYAIGPGMGINAFFAFTLVIGQKVPWPIALGMTFWAGVIFVIVSVTPLREMIAQAIPHGLRIAIAAGIGIFLALIGLKNAGLIAADPVTFVRMGQLTHQSLLAMVGFVLIAVLLKRKNPLAFLAGILGITVGAALLGDIQAPAEYFSWPDFHSVFLKLDIWGALKLSFAPAIFSILFTDLFDSVSTFVGVSHATGLVDENGEPKNLRQGLLVDALSTLCAGLFGTSAGTPYIESSAGIEVGGRTGFTSVVTALCFLPCFFIVPLVALIPEYATAPVLVIIGLYMLRGISTLELEHLEDIIPTLLTMVMIPLTYSIAKGILCGFVSHVVFYSLMGRVRELRPMTWILASVSIALLWVEQGQ